MISSDNYSSETSDVNRFRLFNLCSIFGESTPSTDFGSLPDEKTFVGYLGSGSLKDPSELPLFAKDDAHIIPKRTARQK